MNFLIVDFEFTIHRRYGRPRVWFPEIIEVGAVVVDEKGDLQGKTFNTFVKPKFWPRISEECYGITGIRQKDIEQGISFKQMLESLWQMSPYKGSWLGGWGYQDRQVLKNCCEKYGFEYPFVYENYIDLATEYKLFKNNNNLISLKEAIWETGVKKNGILHAAYDDAVNTALIMQKLIKQGWVNEQNQLSVAM
ncbi:3'-5' exonuclease KapD [Desulfosporosinus sp. SYSU MS00001]|uniref:3'-5' exonuclease KapD n=1 Tax=Desulfosporosinus sp. SYSU MS00001 TaxID=3416284 RepID=UPI003CF89901